MRFWGDPLLFWHYIYSHCGWGWSKVRQKNSRTMWQQSHESCVSLESWIFPRESGKLTVAHIKSRWAFPFIVCLDGLSNLGGSTWTIHHTRETHLFDPFRMHPDLGGGLKYFLFSPRTLGKMNPFWRAYFAQGLVQPPTSDYLTETKHPNEFPPPWMDWMDDFLRCNEAKPQKVAAFVARLEVWSAWKVLVFVIPFTVYLESNMCFLHGVDLQFLWLEFSEIWVIWDLGCSR